ncbi:DUF2752 domain-containing protein [Actinokineospora sp.]|uniref:DUF2752 domain-containing protein n=1 Tax=Actinokineospora sp. TaxID=1872133 RepID=UPI003D6ADE78
MFVRWAALGAGVAAGCAYVLATDPTTPGGLVCPSKWVGLCCPGCGGLRMVYSLLHGRVLDAVHYNAVTLLILPLFVWAAVQWARGKSVTWPRWGPPVLMGVLAAWFVARNLPFEPFSRLYV